MPTPPPVPGHVAPAGLTADDVSHLDTLGVLYYVWGGLTLVCGSFPLIHVAVGLALLAGGLAGGGGPEAAMGGFFAGAGGCVVAVAWLAGGLSLWAGACLRGRRRRVLVIVAAAVSCLSVPLGLILGIFTFLVLNRPQVRAAFEANDAAAGDRRRGFEVG